jgi:hypothetical protein
MPRGGARERAGRPKGSKNKKRTAELAALAESGESPRDYLLNIMRDPSQPADRRDRAAVAAAPYVHPRLAAETHKVEVSFADRLSAALARVGGPE